MAGKAMVANTPANKSLNLRAGNPAANEVSRSSRFDAYRSSGIDVLESTYCSTWGPCLESDFCRIQKMK
jgi:hypothetical protein